MAKVEVSPITLTEKTLFGSDEGFDLTPLGSAIQRLCSGEAYLRAVSGQDPSVNGNPTRARLKELDAEIEEGCAQLNITRGELPSIGAKTREIFEARKAI